MLSNVKKKDVPLIAISLAAIVFIAATLRKVRISRSFLPKLTR